MAKQTKKRSITALETEMYHFNIVLLMIIYCIHYMQMKTQDLS